MVRFLRRPRDLAPWYNGTGTTLYVAGMMVTAFALSAMMRGERRLVARALGSPP